MKTATGSRQARTRGQRSRSEGQSSTLTNDASFLNESSNAAQSQDSPPDTSQYFEAWLETSASLPNPEDNPAGASQPYPRTSLTEDRAAPPGEFRFEGTLRVDCRVTGVIRSETGTMIAGPASEIEADIFVAIAVIYGMLRGHVRATERVELGSAARVIGNIETPVLVLQPGAVVEGQCQFLQRPHKSEREENLRSRLGNLMSSLATVVGR